MNITVTMYLDSIFEGMSQEEIDDLDAERTVEEYRVSLEKWLTWDEYTCEVIGTPNQIASTRITLDPEPDDYRECDALLATIEHEIDRHYESATFWVEA